MKKIIDGKLYNTETAKLIGEYDNGYPQSDFSYYAEALYRKKTGEFFLHTDGGAFSDCAHYSGGSWCGGINIIPLTDAKAIKWCEKHLDVEKYIEIFGEVEE